MLHIIITISSIVAVVIFAWHAWLRMTVGFFRSSVSSIIEHFSANEKRKLQILTGNNDGSRRLDYRRQQWHWS